MKKVSAGLFAVLFLTHCSDNPREKGYEFFPNMVHAVSYQAYSENPLTPDGKTLLPAVEGTIAREAEPFSYGNTEQERARADRELKNPVVLDAKSLARGQAVFEHQCLICHGAQGKGDGPIIPKFPNPPSFSTKRVLALGDGALYHVITRGSGMMPPHALQVLPHDRWCIIHYVKKLREGK